MYVRVCVCVCSVYCMYVQYVRMYVHTFVRIRMCMYAHTYVGRHVELCTYTHVHM